MKTPKLTSSNSTGRYKPMVIAAPVSSSAAFLLIFLRWHGRTSFAESLYIALAGFGNGITMQAVFIFLSAGIKKSENAIAGGGFYLSSSLGEVTGMSCQSAILQAMIRRIQMEKLGGADAGAGVRLFANASCFYFPTHRLLYLDQADGAIGMFCRSFAR